MKKDIHPKYYSDCKVTCACGNAFVTGSTKKEIKVEICSACHPFFTGEQRFVDTEGRVDKFMRKRKEAEEKAGKVKQIKEAKKKRREQEKKQERKSLREMLIEEKKKTQSEKQSSDNNKATNSNSNNNQTNTSDVNANNPSSDKKNNKH